MRELSVYIHIPFCVKKCRYCDFLSYPASEQERKEYLELLLSEIEQQSFFYKGHRVISVFIGGGTPSLLDDDAIKAIFEKLNQNFIFSERPEITIEVNPGTVNAGKLSTYLQLGINRLSIGLQTANDVELQTLGRIHDYRAFSDTCQCARELGFRNINVDLISAVPGQTIDSWRETIQKVLSWAPEHISAYSLILEEGTWFYEHRDELSFLSEEEDRQLYELTGRMLSDAGYTRYEISNYARAGYECLHNKVYWQRGDYVGFGLGAASMVQEVRWSNKRTLGEYRAALQQASGRPAPDRMPARTRFGENIQLLSEEEQMEEFMFLGLRLMKGIEKKAFERKFGIPIENVYGEVLEKLRREGLLSIDDAVRLTAYGIDISCYVMSQFLLG